MPRGDTTVNNTAGGVGLLPGGVIPPPVDFTGAAWNNVPVHQPAGMGYRLFSVNATATNRPGPGNDSLNCTLDPNNPGFLICPPPPLVREWFGTEDAAGHMIGFASQINALNNEISTIKNAATISTAIIGKAATPAAGLVANEFLKATGFYTNLAVDQAVVNNAKAAPPLPPAAPVVTTTPVTFDFSILKWPAIALGVYLGIRAISSSK